MASAVPAPFALQGELAERLCARTPSIDLVRFTNSATEAVMMAVRAARAYTGRDELIMPSNGYHGSWDQVCVSGVDEEHPDGAEGGVPGIPKAVADMAHFVRFNDVGHLEELMRQHGSATAAILLEPILGHILEPGDPEFFRAALRLAHEYGALLILDETITYRLHVGGWQAEHGIEADLTTMGKTIGGGMPVGAFGGKEHVMRIFDPRSDRRAGGPRHHERARPLHGRRVRQPRSARPAGDRPHQPYGGVAGGAARRRGARRRRGHARARLRLADAGQLRRSAGVPSGLPRGRAVHRPARQHEPLDADGR